MKRFLKIAVLTLCLTLSSCVLFNATKNTAAALLTLPFKVAGAAIAILGAATGMGLMDIVGSE